MGPEQFSSLDIIRDIPIQPDGDANYLHFTGGLRGCEVAENRWAFEPILDKGSLVTKGVLSKSELKLLVQAIGLRPIAFNHVDWWKGAYHSTWRPIVPGRAKLSTAASDYWAQIVSGGSKDKWRAADLDHKISTREELERLFDSKGAEESIAQSISISLRNMDISIEYISDFYNEHLARLLLEKKILDDGILKSSLDHLLLAHVHSFFTQLGSARDYVAKLISFRLGLDWVRVDSMGKLIRRLKSSDVEKDKILLLMVSRGLIKIGCVAGQEVRLTGWLKDASELRDRFVHRQPYGFRLRESGGSLRKPSEYYEIYKYHRPLVMSSNEEVDILDTVAEYYMNFDELLFDIGLATGYSSEELSFGPDSIKEISFEIK